MRRPLDADAQRSTPASWLQEQPAADANGCLGDSEPLRRQVAALEAELREVASVARETRAALAELSQDRGSTVARPSTRSRVGTEGSLFMDTIDNHTDIEDQRLDIQRTWATVQELQDRLAATDDSVTVLQDGQRDTNRGLSKVQTILSELSENRAHMKQAMEKRLEEDINILGDDLRSTNSGLKQVRMETQALTASLRKESEDRNTQRIRAKEFANDMSVLRLSVQALETRVEANTEGRKVLQAELADAVAATVKLNDNQDTACAGLQNLAGRVKKVQDHVKSLNAKLETTSSGLSTAEDRIRETVAETKDLRRLVDQALDGVQMLGESHNNSTWTINNLHAQLTQIGGTTQALKAGLKEHSQLLLPNIILDNPEVGVFAANQARMPSSRHGTLLLGNLVRAPSPRGNPARGTPRTATPLPLAPLQEMEWT
eukprot:CAMPEP_0172736552 /NCGR_PEP_ID=MMETSP1074-20121228/115363_1 /TAXON_ID=2916 /ORGANISM="Ceratium fusus, Strain PA161109" /LENGTH=431 /DNA_ID=CAMNT_0013565773 /DNA_START=8 /DNA_END=1303 /DNA_ORIENTATION=+